MEKLVTRDPALSARVGGDHGAIDGETLAHQPDVDTLLHDALKKLAEPTIRETTMPVL